jgi:hypothetical protein
MANEIEVTALALKDATALTTSAQIITYEQTGDATRTPLDLAVKEVNSNSGIRAPYTTTANIPVGGSGVTVVVPVATYPGTIFSVAVWDANQQIQVTTIKGTSGSDQTVQLISAKEYTGVTINIILV